MLPDLKPDQAAIVTRMSELARDVFASRAATYDAEARFPRENYTDLHRAGLLGLTIPREFGGAGVDWLTYAICMHELGKACSATALTFNMHAVILDFLAHLGTPEQRRRWFGEVIDGGKLFSSVTSEPTASFRHKFVLSTVLTPVEGGYRLNGVKHFGSLGEHSDYHFVTAMLEGSTTAREGQQSVIVPRTSAGVSVERTWNSMGMRGTSSDTIKYANTFVPDADRVGGIAALASIDITGFGLGYAAIYLGIGEAAFDYVLDYVKATSYKLPEPMSHQPATQRSVGEMATSIRAARALLWEAASVRMKNDRAASTLAVNEAKAFCSEVGTRVCEQAIRLAGGRGILKNYPLERYMRDAICGPVMSPANERCMETVGKILCGLEGRTLEYA
jgi:alkylation response protein AidB-like acyl-CoA dehydrogenase